MKKIGLSLLGFMLILAVLVTPVQAKKATLPVAARGTWVKRYHHDMLKIQLKGKVAYLTQGRGKQAHTLKMTVRRYNRKGWFALENRSSDPAMVKYQHQHLYHLGYLGKWDRLTRTR
ncbi:hypothetical protein [Lactiplantibacillus daowaiensis]|uniref:Extracellular protein n=1 Tax=Lactiplantibacillus daowaiensis TaxID=2559918 RepID=A0ABW1S4Q3_9LACO|nr:hypothetical protein [Lactiplantibacillus daowaiensis]